MTSGSLNNQIGILDEGSIANKRTRQIYLSFDVDLRKIDTGSNFLNKTLKVLSFIKVPSPAIMFDNKKNTTIYPLYYGQ